MVIPITYEIWAFPFRLAFCSFSPSENLIDTEDRLIMRLSSNPTLSATIEKCCGFGDQAQAGKSRTQARVPSKTDAEQSEPIHRKTMSRMQRRNHRVVVLGVRSTLDTERESSR